MTEPTEPQGPEPEPVPAPERRAEISALLALVQNIHADVKSLHNSTKNLDKRLTAHMLSESVELAEAVTKLLTAAFPEGDATGHRKHHEAVIAKAEARAKFWRKMAEEITKYGLLGLVGWLVAVAWSAFLQGPHK